MNTKVEPKCWHEAPFDSRGNQYSFPSWDSQMRSVSVFEDTLTFVEFERGRSAANAVWERSNGTTCVMFLTDLAAAIPTMTGGRISGKFRFVKRGQNYGVALA